MPGGDGTGPFGMGEMTGRGVGYCAGYAAPGFANPIPGRGFGGGFSRGGGSFVGGRGRRNRFWATGQPGWMRSSMAAEPYGYGAFNPGDPEMEKRLLRNQAENLQSQLETIKKRLGELGTED